MPSTSASRAATHAIIGVDIGATTTAAGLVTRTGEVLHSVQRPTHHDGPGTALTGLVGVGVGDPAGNTSGAAREPSTP